MYLNESLYVFTGGPGSGKTSVINELKKLGYGCADEVARQIIRREVENGGDALPWKDTALYTSYMLSESVDSYYAYLPGNTIVFFDRGIPDSLAYARLINLEQKESLWSASCDYRYNRKVFIFPPWKEIFCGDEERKQSFQEAVKTYEEIQSVYKELGYLLIEVPLISVSDRVDFILSSLDP